MRWIRQLFQRMPVVANVGQTFDLILFDWKRELEFGMWRMDGSHGRNEDDNITSASQDAFVVTYTVGVVSYSYLWRLLNESFDVSIYRIIVDEIGEAEKT